MKHYPGIGFAVAIAAAVAGGAAYAGGLQIVAHAIVPGGGNSASPGGCRRLEATFGEAVAGRASGGSYTVTAGFQANPSTHPRDSIFRNGFQECQ